MTLLVGSKSTQPSSGHHTDSHAWDYLFLDVTETKNFSHALEMWSKTGANLMIWDYAVDFYNYMRLKLRKGKTRML